MSGFDMGCGLPVLLDSSLDMCSRLSPLELWAFLHSQGCWSRALVVLQMAQELLDQTRPGWFVPGDAIGQPKPHVIVFSWIQTWCLMPEDSPNDVPQMPFRFLIGVQLVFVTFWEEFSATRSLIYWNGSPLDISLRRIVVKIHFGYTETWFDLI